MAQIPLSQIPNAPDLSSMARPMVNEVNAPKVDFSGERAAVAAGYGAVIRSNRVAEQDANNAGFIGKAVAGVGDETAKVAGEYIKKQQELNGIAGRAQFEALNSQVMDDVSSSLDPTQPHTWMGQFNQKWKQVTDWYAAQPQDVQRAVYPDLLRSQYGNMASIGISAHKTDIANKTASTISQVQQLAENGLYDDAKSLTDGLMHSGAIPIPKKNEIFQAIDSYKTDAIATGLIAQDPGKAADLFQRAATAGDFTNAPDWMKGLQPKELSNYAKKAESVKFYRETDQGMVAFDAIDQGRIKTMQQLKSSEVYKSLTPKWQAASESKLLNEVVAGSPEGIKAVGDAYGSLNAFRTGKVDDLAKDYHDMKLIGANLPPADAKQFLKEVDQIFQKRSENGGTLPYDQQIRTSVSSELHKMYKDGGFGDPSSQEALSAYQQAEKDWNKVTAENPHSYAEAESKFWQTQKNAAAASILKKGPVEQKPSWFTHPIDRWNYTPPATKPQASSDMGEPTGKVTEYYPSEGYRAATKGAFNDNRLDNESMAVSPDIQQQFKARGIKPLDKVKLTLANGQTVIRRYDDHTATDEEAKKQGLPPLRGRYDFRVPVKGASGVDGVKVAKVEKYTEDGRG